MELHQALEALAALAQDSRLSVFRQLVRQGPQGLPAGRIAESLGIPKATLSFHLAQLGHADLVIAHRAGRSILYAANYETMRQLIAFLTACCCQSDGIKQSSAVTRRARTRKKKGR